MNKLFLAIVGCLLASCAPKAPPASTGTYVARGQEPGWIVKIANGRIDYTGNYGEVRINAPATGLRTTFNGHRYETGDGRNTLVVDITHGRCNDAMSGFGFADQVMVVANGKTFRGCGGARKPEWDN